MYWIIPANPKKYDTVSAFRNLPYVDWKKNVNFSKGDIVFIYTASPKQLIEVCAKVISADIAPSDMLDDKEYCSDIEFYKSTQSKKYVRLELVGFNSSELLNLEYLMANGLSSAPRRQLQLSKEVADYILSCFNTIDTINYPEEILTDEKKFSEGAVKVVNVNYYERNPIARAECIKNYGATCQVCGLDFKNKYGEFAKNYIHVHHLVPISDIGKEYQIDPVKDLLPVCPNCHAMLHRKDPNGNYLTVAELKNLIPSRYKYF